MQDRLSSLHTLAAPVRGLVLNENIAASGPQAARVLDNWIPEEDGVRVRRGTSRHGTLDANAVSMVHYKGHLSETILAFTATDMYSMGSPASADAAEDPVFTQLTAGYFTGAPMTTPGGDFLALANGADHMILWNGSAAYPLCDEAISTLAYDALTAAFTIGDTVTGGTSGASATIFGVVPATATTGTLLIGAVASGPFQDNEAITDGAGGAATADGTATSVQAATVSGVATNTLKSVHTFKNRLYAVEKDTLRIWYWPVQSIGGLLKKIELAGIVERGGNLLYIATWSMDSGDGMDDRLVAVTDQGEVVVYEGDDPNSFATWRLAGRYFMAKPLGERSWTRAAGDLMMATREGVVPLSQVVTKEPAAISATAASRPIEPLWRALVSERGAARWEIHKSYDNDWAVIIPPAGSGDDLKMLIVNMKTGAWACYTGIDAQCGCEYANDVYVGNTASRILKLDNGGDDDGSAYYARMAMQFDHLGSYAAWKQVHMMRATFLSNLTVNARLSISEEYENVWPAAPAVSAVASNSVWDTAVWDTDVWYQADPVTVETDWVDIGMSGRVISAQVEVGIDSGADPVVKFASIDVLYAKGQAVA